MTHSLSVAGECVFVGMLAEPGVEGVSYTTGGSLVHVYSAKTGELLGDLNPDNTSGVGSSGWLDVACVVTPPPPHTHTHTHIPLYKH
jgi:hypothetical protein